MDHHHGSEALSGSLRAFQSDVSNCLNQLMLDSKPGSEILSLSWFKQSFKLFPAMNKAFAKLVVEIEYPISKWEVDFVEEYLNYSLNLLELLNSINASRSHLGHVRLALSHALALVEKSPSSAIQHLNAILIQNRVCKEENRGNINVRPFSSKEEVAHEGLVLMQRIGFWICGIVLSGLSGDAQPYLEIRKLANSSANSSLMNLDSCIHEAIIGRSVMKDVNDAAANLLNNMVIGKTNNANPAEKLRTKLEVFEKLLIGIQEEVGHVFSEVLAGRNELLDIIRRRKH